MIKQLSKVSLLIKCDQNISPASVKMQAPLRISQKNDYFVIVYFVRRGRLKQKMI